MNATEQFWAGSFGNQYTDRNRVKYHERMPFWLRVLERTQPASVLEVGANAGWNLRAIRGLAQGVKLSGIDVNLQAVQEAQDCGLNVAVCPAADVGRLWPDSADLVFTAGVLIHIPPEQLPEVMASIIQASRRWVLAVEYSAEVEEPVEYRGHADRLWRRPFGRLYEGLGLRLVWSGPADGFDNCCAWLLSKD